METRLLPSQYDSRCYFADVCLVVTVFITTGHLNVSWENKELHFECEVHLIECKYQMLPGDSDTLHRVYCASTVLW